MPVPASVFRMYRPSPELRHYVCGYMMFTTEGEEPPRTQERFFADGSSETRFHSSDPLLNHMLPGGYPSITFNFGDPWKLRGGGRPMRTLHRAWAMGPATRPAVCDFGPRGEALGVMFHAGQARLFLGASAPSLTDTVAPLDHLWGPVAARLEAQLAEAPSLPEKIRLLEGELLRRVRAARWVDAGMQRITRFIEREQGAVSIASLSRASGLSRQHLARKFRERVGVTPKQFCRFVRFHSLVNHIYYHPRVNWAEVAAEFGYYDQAHLISEFKEFTGMTPTEFSTPHHLPAVPPAEIAAD